MPVSPNLRVILATGFVSISGFLFGYDTGSIGAITLMPSFVARFGELSPLVRGFVVACILIPSALSGVIAGPISDRISRKYSISLGAGIFTVGQTMSTASPGLGVLIVGRCISGVGEGLFLSATGVYICETSPAHLRGKMLSVFSTMIASGIAIGFFSCYASINIQSSLSWRLPFAISTFASLLLAVGCFYSPFLVFSPRWLMLKGRVTEAEDVLDLIAGTVEERQEMLAANGSTEKSGRFRDIFSKGFRGRTLLGAFLNIFQQLTGIDFVLYFAPLLFLQAGLTAQSASFFASGVTGILLVAATVTGTLYIDKIGRRRLFIVGGVIIVICHFTLGTMYLTRASETAVGKWVCIVFIEIFAVGFAGTWSLVIRLYATEIQPNRTRASASSFGQGLNQAFNFVVALTGPAFLAESSYGPYFLYGSFTAFATFIAWLYMVETIGKSLESIDTSFNGSPYAVNWPEMFQSRITDARIRRSSRPGLQGETTRTELKRDLIALEMIGSAIEE